MAVEKLSSIQSFIVNELSYVSVIVGILRALVMPKLLGLKLGKN